MLYIVKNLMSGSTISHVPDRNIDRLLTPEEIEEFELQRSADKYNL